MKLLPLLISGDKEGVKADSTTSQSYQEFDEMSDAKNVILRGSQLVVPTVLQYRMFEFCYVAHLGIVKSKQLLRSKLWFPRIDTKMEAKISVCVTSSHPTKTERPASHDGNTCHAMAERHDSLLRTVSDKISCSRSDRSEAQIPSNRNGNQYFSQINHTGFDQKKSLFTESGSRSCQIMAHLSTANTSKGSVKTKAYSTEA